MELDHAYDILMVSYGSSLEDVKRAYRLEAQLVHPDKIIDLPETVRQHAEERFKQVNEAYQTLTEYIEANGAPAEPEWQPKDEWTPRTAPAASFVNSDSQPHERISPAEAYAQFVGGEATRGYGRMNLDRSSLNIIAAVLFASAIIIRGCMYHQIHKEFQRQREPVDTTQTQQSDGSY